MKYAWRKFCGVKFGYRVGRFILLKYVEFSQKHLWIYIDTGTINWSIIDLLYFCWIVSILIVWNDTHGITHTDHSLLIVVHSLMCCCFSNHQYQQLREYMDDYSESFVVTKISQRISIPKWKWMNVGKGDSVTVSSSAWMNLGMRPQPMRGIVTV